MLQNLKTKYVGFESLKSVIWWALSSEDIYISLVWNSQTSTANNGSCTYKESMRSLLYTNWRQKGQ